jgi:CP family cyanate transporter-like MFS transporter
VQQEKSSSMPWAILGSASLLIFAVLTQQLCIPPIEHIIKESLGITHAQTSLLVSIPLIVTAALAMPAGILADRIGIRKTAGTGAIFLTIGAILRGLTTDFPLLLAFTSMIGIGNALVFPNLPKLVSLWVPIEKAGIATGIYSTGMGIGGALAVAITPSLIFPITNTFQGTLLIWSIPCIIATIIWWTIVKDIPIYEHVTESEKRQNITIRQVLSNKNIWLIAIMLFLGQAYFFNWTTWSPTLMMEIGASTELAALISSLTLWISIPTFLLVPRISYKIGLKKPFLWIPPVIMALAAFWAMHITIPMGWPLMVLVGISYNVLFITVLALPVEIMPQETVGTASGLIISIGFAGGVLGPMIGGYILDITGSLNTSLLILIGIAIVATITGLRIPETGPKASVKK